MSLNALREYNFYFFACHYDILSGFFLFFLLVANTLAFRIVHFILSGFKHVTTAVKVF